MENMIELIKEDLDWHKNHRGCSYRSEEYEDGFIKGIEHAILLSEKSKVNLESAFKIRFKNIINGKGLLVPRIAVKVALNDILKETNWLCKKCNYFGPHKECPVCKDEELEKSACPVAKKVTTINFMGEKHKLDK